MHCKKHGDVARNAVTCQKCILLGCKVWFSFNATHATNAAQRTQVTQKVRKKPIGCREKTFTRKISLMSKNLGMQNFSDLVHRNIFKFGDKYKGG